VGGCGGNAPLRGVSALEPSAPSDQSADESIVVRCARHPGVETSLRCGRCNTPICPRCAVPTPVGARCPTCAQVKRFATVLKPTEVARAIVLGLGVAMAGSLIASLIPIIRVLPVVFVGYAVSEVVSLAVNRKRGTEVGVLAVGCFVVGYFLAPLLQILLSGNLAALAFAPTIILAYTVGTLRDLFAIVALAIGALIGWMRVR
jgi:hypothetical protein